MLPHLAYLGSGDQNPGHRLEWQAPPPPAISPAPSDNLIQHRCPPTAPVPHSYSPQLADSLPGAKIGLLVLQWPEKAYQGHGDLCSPLPLVSQ